jgi:hypothetical protein
VVADASGVLSASGSYAQNASPTFTGTPTAPTATAGTNTTQLATTAFVLANATAVAQTINNGVTTSAPSQDAVFDALALKAGIGSPVFSGVAEATGGFKTNGNLVLTTTGTGLSAPNNGSILFTANIASNPGWTSNAPITATSFIKSGGTSSQFLKADGSIDTNTYVTSASGVIAGSFTATGTATTTFTVTIGSTQANNTYKIAATGSNAMSAASFFISNKTTTTFDVSYLTALTGAIAFDWILKP